MTLRRLRISIDREVVKNEEATFYARVSGEAMQGAGLDDGDLLVIDRSLEPQDNKIAVCFIDGEFTVKRLKVEEDCVYLMPENSKLQTHQGNRRQPIDYLGSRNLCGEKSLD